MFQSSTFLYDEQAAYHDVPYIRLNDTPNHHALADALAGLAAAEAALVTVSGMAAIGTALLAVLQAGDHLVAQRGRSRGGRRGAAARDAADDRGEPRRGQGR